MKILFEAKSKLNTKISDSSNLSFTFYPPQLLAEGSLELLLSFFLAVSYQLSAFLL
jgi:hypothetical protein